MTKRTRLLHRVLLASACCFGTVTLAACIPPSPEPTPAPSPAPPPVAAPAPTPAPAPPPTPVTPAFDNWLDAPATPGDWSYVSEPAESLAVFGTSRSASGVELIIRCDLATRRVGIARAGIARAGNASGQVQMLIRTETQERTLTANPVDGPAPLIATELSATDGLLDAMAFSRGRFAVETVGAQPLYAPAYPEITRVIEDCRN